MQGTSVRCPRCGNANTVPVSAAPTPVRCPICRTAYIAPPATSRPLPPQVAQARISSKLPPPPPPEEPAPAPPPDPQTSRRIGALWGLVALLLLGVFSLCLALGVVAARRGWNPLTGSAQGRPLGKTASQAGNQPEQVWPSAEKPLERDGVQFRITTIAIGSVRGRDEKNNPLVIASGKYLKLFIEVTNLGPGDLNYTSWYGNRFEENGAEVEALLSDIHANPFSQLGFDRMLKLQGHTPLAVVPPGRSVLDVLIFSVPADQLAKEESLYLELPAGALSRTTSAGVRELPGWFQLEIPAHLLDGL